MSEAKKEEGEAGKEAKPKGKKKFLFIIIGLVVLVAGAGVPMFLMGGDKSDSEHEEEQEAPKKIETADLGLFVVNLSETASFLKVRITAEYDSAILDRQLEASGEGGGHGEGGGASGGESKAAGPHPYITKRMTQIQDTIIRVLSSKRAVELLTQDGKDRLKDELLEGINEAIGTDEPAVSGIFFTEFIIQ